MSSVGPKVRAKEEAGDVLHYIDFHQLQIENKQQTSKLDGLNAELLALKVERETQLPLVGEEGAGTRGFV